jgi:hypothetical protein
MGLASDRPTFVKIVGLAFLVGVSLRFGEAQSLESRLSQKADFSPASTSTKEQLIEVAQHYRIPMGIQWVSVPNNAALPAPAEEQPTVKDLIDSILRRTPSYKFEIVGQVVNVFHVSFADDPRNFLNIRIANYEANRENVFGAEALLRFNIHRTLHPELYARGWNGGYGYGARREDGFDVKNISFSGKNVTVREILNEIAEQNGNALWIVDLTPSKMMKDGPFFAQGVSGNQADFIWRIIPLEPVVKQSK